MAVVARHFGVEHTTVSRRIAALEAVLDETLFDRSAKGRTLTPMGAQLLRSAFELCRPPITLLRSLMTPRAAGARNEWFSVRVDAKRNLQEPKHTKDSPT